MKGIARQLAAALVTTFPALGFAAGAAGAGSQEGGHEGDHKSKSSGVSQSLTQQTSLRFDDDLSIDAGSQLPGTLASPRTGLTPAG
jgi:hypothetical protein